MAADDEGAVDDPTRSGRTRVGKLGCFVSCGERVVCIVLVLTSRQSTLRDTSDRSKVTRGQKDNGNANSLAEYRTDSTMTDDNDNDSDNDIDILCQLRVKSRLQ